MRLTKLGSKWLLTCDYSEREVAKSLGGRWNALKRCWVLTPTRSAYDRLSKEACFISPEIIAMSTPLATSNPGNYFYKTKPYQHQTLLINLVLEKKKVFFFCGVGTGKSKAIIDSMSKLKLSKVLVITPASILYNFAEQITLHSDDEFTILSGTLDKRKALLKTPTKYHILNYDMVCKLEDDLIKQNYDALILDECHRVSNRGTKWSKAIYRLSKNIDYKIGLTGTAISNGYENLYMQYKII